MTGLLNHLSITLKLNFRSVQAVIYGYVVPIFFLFALGTVFASKPPLRADMGRLLTITILGGACFGMPTSMVAERERGVWRRYRLLPTATAGIILSAMVARFFILLSAGLMQVLLARLIYKTPFPDHPVGMLGAFVFVCFAFLGLGLVIAMVANNVPAVQALGQAIFLPLIIIGGVGVRLESLPLSMQHIANFLPGRYAVDALQACQTGPGIVAARFNLLSLTVIGLAAILAGAKLFRWDVGQKIAGPARAWVALAVVGWVAVGMAAEYPQWKEKLRVHRESQWVTTPGGTARPSSGRVLIAPTTNAATEPTIAVAPTTSAATEPTVVIAPAQAWEKLTQAEIDTIQYDDLPDDNSTTTPLAPNLDNLDDDSKKRMDALADGLGDWAPATVADLPQRIRNLLSVCAVADVAQDQNEAQIPYIVFNYLKSTIPKNQLVKALSWDILHDRDGTVLTNVKDIKELSIDAEIQEDDVRQRSNMYGKKLLFRLLGKKPPAN